MESKQTHVVMLVANNISNDSRVMKEAVALARGGLRVTLLGVSLDRRLAMDSLDGWVVTACLPGVFTLRDARTKRRKRRRGLRLPLLGPSVRVELSARRALLQARRADVELRTGAGNRLGYAARRTAFLGAQVRGRLAKIGDHWMGRGWRAWDGLVSRTEWPVSWPAVVPEAYDYETIFGPVIDRLDPDVIHGHDMHVIGVAVRAAARARRAGRDVKVVYDAHEYVPGIARYGGRTRRFIAAWASHERDYIRATDRVVTVSPAIAERLQRDHRLKRLPEVVLNTPDLPMPSEPVEDIRSRTGLSADVPLLVYSGGITVVRGIETAIEALPLLPGVHLAIVAVPSPNQPAVELLWKQAADLGVADRVHLLHPVRTSEVTAFLRTADAGIIPMLRAPNHEMAMPHKLFEYSLSGLPVLVSDMASLKEFVARTGIGESFAAGQSQDFAAKAELLLGRTETYRKRLADPVFHQEASWSVQADKLRALYGELLGREVTSTSRPPRTGRQVLIGPAGPTGQSRQLARAIERYEPSITARPLPLERTTQEVPAGLRALAVDHPRDAAWRVELAEYVRREVTQVLFDAGSSLFGETALSFSQDLALLDRSGVRHGMLLHGPDVRLASTAALEALAGYGGTRFVTDPSLLTFVTDAVWLPLVVDTPDSVPPVLQAQKPVVVALPSGTEQPTVDAVLTDLAAYNLIEYRPLTAVDDLATGAWLQDADIVVDDLSTGTYGLAACQALAAGRVVVGQVHQHVRQLLPADLPIIDALPTDLGAVIDDILLDRTGARETARAGTRYVREYHDGQKSVEALQPFLTLSTGAE